MSNVKMFCDALPNIPWQEKPADVTAPVWRYSENPIIDRNPVEGVARIFNSAVVPYEGKFIGVFRGEQVDGIPYIYLGRSEDGIHWNFDKDKIPFVNEKGEPFMPVYAYDPRLVKVEDTYYHLVSGLLRCVHRHRQDHRLQDLCPHREPLYPLQPQRRAVPPQDQRHVHPAEPPV